MEQQKNKIVKLFLFVVLALSLMPPASFAEDKEKMAMRAEIDALKKEAAQLKTENADVKSEDRKSVV